MNSTLVFVYNAESGIFNALSGLAHKILSAETYPCSLCALTYSSFGMRKEWKQFLKSLDVRKEFLGRSQGHRGRGPGVSDYRAPMMSNSKAKR